MAQGKEKGLKTSMSVQPTRSHMDPSIHDLLKTDQRGDLFGVKKVEKEPKRNVCKIPGYAGLWGGIFGGTKLMKKSWGPLLLIQQGHKEI